ncbi:MAG: glycoside hydrolase family 140 protein [Roseiflexaceae bacterium]
MTPFTPSMPRLSVSADGHGLTAGGAPFFWLGDTAWELFHRLDLAEAQEYLALRARQGFTVIQAVALAELDGLRVPNANGDLPLHDEDPDQPNEAYFAHVDRVIEVAARYGLYVALLPTWGDKVTLMWGPGPVVFDPGRAERYGRWLGARYRDYSHVVWVLGGDRPPEGVEGDARPVWRAMASGLRESSEALICYHPPGGLSSADWLHGEDWLDLHMLQSGHSERDAPTWELVGRGYALAPPKPILDAEPNYEDHPVRPWPDFDPARGYFRDHDVRKQAYRSVLAGGCGVTYGHHAVWQFYDPARRDPVNHPDRDWRSALERPGAVQLIHLRRLVESRPSEGRLPDQGLLAGDSGAGGGHIRAVRDAAGRYALVYLPEPQPVTLRLEQLGRTALRGWWYDPCNGAATLIGELPAGGEHTFVPPPGGPDWVLVLDDPACGFGAPGAVG